MFCGAVSNAWIKGADVVLFEELRKHPRCDQGVMGLDDELGLGIGTMYRAAM